MKRDIRLYIQGERLELDDNISLPITKSFSDLTDPVAIKNSFSRTIKIPSTPNNDKIFTHIWRLDHIITSFDPSKRVDFELSVDGYIFDTGYMKLNNITYSQIKDDKPDWYNVHLYGGLGDFFYNLSQKDMQDLFIFSNLQHTVNRTTVKQSFDGSGFAYENYMKYCPVYEGFYADFESDRVYLGINADGEFNFLDLSGDRDEWQRRELRSYYQRPAVKISTIIDGITAQSGVPVDFDTSFRSASNPYYTNLYCVCPPYNTAANNNPNGSDTAIRSNSQVQWKDMIGTGKTQLDFLLSYIKPFGLIVQRNPVTGRVSINTRETHFQNYSIVDWTEKLDYSRTYEKNPIPFDYKFAVLRWNEGTSFYEELYKQKFTRPYGQVRADTGYDFDDNEKILLNDNMFYNSITSFERDSYFARWTGFSTGVGSVENPAGNLLAMFNTSNKTRENNKDGLTLAFYNGTKLLRTGNDVIQVRLSDDNLALASEGIYCWEYYEPNIEGDGGNFVILPENQVPINTIPSFVRRTVTHSLDFAVPNEEYIDSMVYDPNSTIYNRYWKYFLEERLNVNNHILTAYFYLTDEEVQGWDFTKFVRIHNVTYFVNKIQDFDLNGTSSTKCELIRVTDINRYINFVDYSLSINPTSSSFRYSGGNGTITVTSNLPPTVSTSASWITVNSTTWNGTNYISSFTVEQNTSENQRVGYIYYTNGRNTVMYTVTQLGYPYVNVTPVSQTTDVTSKTVTFIVSSNYPVNIE